jgi:hypothetical protein
LMALAGMAPLSLSASSPLRKRIIVGMLRMSKRAATSGSASVSTLATMTCPARSAATLSSSGATTRQGGHHSAQKSTRTGPGASRTSSSKSCVLERESGWAGGRSVVLQTAHLALSRARLAGSRLGLAHDVHSTIMTTSSIRLPSAAQGGGSSSSCQSGKLAMGGVARSR